MKIGAWEAGIDLYGVLGVSKESTRQRIRSAYRRRIFDCHPDARQPGERRAAEARTKLINLAGAVLLDPATRARYDALRAARVARSRSKPPPRRGPATSEFWPFTQPIAAPASPQADEPVRPPPPIDGLTATLLLAASFVLGFWMLAWLATPIPLPSSCDGDDPCPSATSVSASSASAHSTS
jgi:curved DNA-binding protein CbpA